MERCPVLHPATAQVTEWISGERLELTAARDLDEALGLFSRWRVERVGFVRRCWDRSWWIMHKTGTKMESRSVGRVFGQCCQHLYIQCCSVFLARKGQLGILWCFDYAVIGSKFDIHLRPSTDGISKKQATLSPRFRKFIQMPETNLFNLAIQRYQDISKIDGPLQTHSDFLGEKKLFRGRH